jgi:simple sugar transport system permease protein
MAFLFPELALLSFAMLLAMLSGGIDLSVVSTANLSGILAALILTRCTPEQPNSMALSGTIALAVTAALGCGLVCGAFNGLLISRVGISPILVTLGTMQLYVGVALVVTEGRAVLGFPERFLEIGNGTWLGLPAPFLLFLLGAAVIWVLSSRTVFGYHLRLLGTNPVAARFSGIRVRSVLFRTYVATGAIAGATGLLMIARTNSAKADYGSSYLLQSILVVVLGGTNPAGGFGTVFGVSVAVVALQLLASGFNMLHFSNFARDFIWGLFLLVVMVSGRLGREGGRRPQSGVTASRR